MQVVNKKNTFVCFVILLIAAGLYAYFYYQRLYPSTDDAYIQAHVINISSRVSGTVSKISTKDNDHVEKGQHLLTIDPRNFENSVNEADASVSMAEQQAEADQARINIAKAKLSRAKTNLELQKKQYARIHTLVKKGQASVASGDSAKSQHDSAVATVTAADKELEEAQKTLGKLGKLNARVRKAAAALQQANLNLSFTEITAPESGYITKFKLRRGTVIQAGQPQFYLVEDTAWWVEANFKETQIENIKVGQRATIKTDMYPNIILHGYVGSISRGSGTVFSLLPPENATGNWVKVTQRFPVKIVITDIDPSIALRMGSSASVTIDTQQPLDDQETDLTNQPAA